MFGSYQGQGLVIQEWRILKAKENVRKEIRMVKTDESGGGCIALYPRNKSGRTPITGGVTYRNSTLDAYSKAGFV